MRSVPSLQYAKKLAQDRQPEFCINMFENMLGKYKLA